MANFFDPLEWLNTNGKDVTADLPSGDLYDIRSGYKATHLMLDKTPPDGNVILNPDFNNGEIKVYHFKTTGSPTYVMQDNVGNYLYPLSTTLDGAANENIFESIGYADNTAIVAVFTSGTTITSIEFCATASKPKQYVIEYQKSTSNKWIPVVYMIANQQTRDSFSITGISLADATAVRLRYKGDYYASSNSGEVILSAFDELTLVKKAKISRYTDFSDATDFAGGENITSDGWFDFVDDVYVFNWELNNNKRLWSKIAGSPISTSPYKYMIPLGSNLVLINDNQFFTMTNTSVVQRNSILPDKVTSVAMHNNQLFIGTQSGKIWYTSNGEIYNTLPMTNSLPVTALESYQNLLYIGTNNEGSKAILYAWDETNDKLITVFNNFTQPKITALAAAQSSLYIGLSGAEEQNLAAVYRYNGSTCVMSIDLNADGVETMIYSAINRGLWVALTGGQIYLASFVDPTDSTKMVTDPIWGSSPYYDNDSLHFFNITSDPTKSSLGSRGEANDFVWISSDTSLLAFVDNITRFADPVDNTKDKTVETTYFESVAWPTSYEQGLMQQFITFGLLADAMNGNMNGAANIITVPTSVVNYTDFPSSVDAANKRIEITGWVKANYTEKYTFYVTCADGVRLTIGDSPADPAALSVIDVWQTGAEATEKSGTIDMMAGQWKYIHLVVFNQSTSPEVLKLQWSSLSQPKQIIPETALVDTLTQITDIAYFNNDIYGTSRDGFIYKIDSSLVGNKTKKVFVRFKDEANNATPDTSDVDKGYLYDEVVQDTETSDTGTKISDGRIYQVKPNKEVASTFLSPVQSSLTAPDRELQAKGFYLSNPLYVANLTRWDKISFLCNLPATVPSVSGLQNGVAIELYVRTANTREDLLNIDWSLPFERNTIDGTWAAGNNVLAEFNIAALQGKWIQYYIVMTSASRNVTPVLLNITLSYMGTQDSYFFSSVYDTENIIGGYYNLLQNPDFEDGDPGAVPATWYSSSELPIGTTSNDALEGYQSLYIDGRGKTLADYIVTYFQIERAFSGRQLVISFDYETSADYVDGSLVLRLWNNSAGIDVIMPEPASIPASPNGGTFTAVFTVDNWYSSDSSKYHDYQISFETTMDNTFTSMIVDNMYIGPEYKIIDNPPQFYRALLAANTIVDSGEVTFGYITDETASNRFDFQQYTRIKPNVFFELPKPASKIRFGAMLITAGGTPTKICDFAVQLDAGEQDMLLMIPPVGNAPASVGQMYNSQIAPVAVNFLLPGYGAGGAIINSFPFVGDNGFSPWYNINLLTGGMMPGDRYLLLQTDAYSGGTYATKIHVDFSLDGVTINESITLQYDSVGTQTIPLDNMKGYYPFIRYRIRSGLDGLILVTGAATAGSSITVAGGFTWTLASNTVSASETISTFANMINTSSSSPVYAINDNSSSQLIIVPKNPGTSMTLSVSGSKLGVGRQIPAYNITSKLYIVGKGIKTNA